MGEKSNRALSENNALLVAVVIIGWILSPLFCMAIRAVDYQMCYVKVSEDIQTKVETKDLIGKTREQVIDALDGIAPFQVYEILPTEDGMHSEYVGFTICMYDKVDYQLIFHDSKLEEYRRYNFSE